ncbi:MAG: hypothetical protein LBC39_06380 [Methanobrevibacter sp.]|jgi:hypothetical protein|nr:hypothetical protein [Candidatus Methanovirga aequatorialis]
MITSVTFINSSNYVKSTDLELRDIISQISENDTVMYVGSPPSYIFGFEKYYLKGNKFFEYNLTNITNSHDNRKNNTKKIIYIFDYTLYRVTCMMKIN